MLDHTLHHQLVDGDALCRRYEQNTKRCDRFLCFSRRPNSARRGGQPSPPLSSHTPSFLTKQFKQTNDGRRHLSHTRSQPQPKATLEGEPTRPTERLDVGLGNKGQRWIAVRRVAEIVLLSFGGSSQPRHSRTRICCGPPCLGPQTQLTRPWTGPGEVLQEEVLQEEVLREEDEWWRRYERTTFPTSP